MKRYMKIMLVLLCVAVFTAGSAENVIFNDNTLELLSPCEFFDGKYTLTYVEDSSTVGSDFNWINCYFKPADNVTTEEVKADAARYRQALIDSGYFKQSEQVSHLLVYIGDREVSVATDEGKIDGWHVGVQNRMRINLVEGFSFSDLAVGSSNQKSAEKMQSAPGSKSVATNDGLTVLSPEQYLGIAPCDEIYREDNHYTYAYTDRGNKYHGSGTANPVDWYKMEEYVNALVESGYYEILEHSDDPDDAYWTLRYIGPAEVNNTFDLYYGMSDQAAITLRNFIGDIKVRYSIDILTADIAENQQRLGEYVVAAQQSSAGGSGGNCTYCGGDGKCDECGGDVWYYDFDFVYVNGAPELQYVRKMCTDANCSYGKCYMCGGDGVR